jgi:hypothetical protein
MVFRLFRRKDPVVAKTAVAAEPMTGATEVVAETGAGPGVPESAQPKALKARRAANAGKGRKPAPKPARKTKQPSSKVAKRGAGGKAKKPKGGR